jgi:hypothetical protein
VTDEERKVGDETPQLPKTPETPKEPAETEAPRSESPAQTVRQMRAEQQPQAEAVATDEPEPAAPSGSSAAATMGEAAQTVAALNIFPKATGDGTTNYLGRQLSLGIYDVVFISLGVFTLIEVFVSEVFPRMPIFPGFDLKIALLLVLTIIKAFHVVWYYMHLNHDSRLFWATLLLPAFVASLSMLYLATVPVTGY